MNCLLSILIALSLCLLCGCSTPQKVVTAPAYPPELNPTNAVSDASLKPHVPRAPWIPPMPVTNIWIAAPSLPGLYVAWVNDGGVWYQSVAFSVTSNSTHVFKWPVDRPFQEIKWEKAI